MSQPAPDAPFSVYYHTHWDREWYLPFRAYQVRLAEAVDAILERLEQHSFSCFMLDGQTVVLEDYLAFRPENRHRVQTLIQNGRLRVGPWFVMPDEFLVSGESLIRNLMRGIREARAFGCHEYTGYLPDTFGHSADIPSILRHCGIQTAVVWRGIQPSQSCFQWKSPQGDTVLALHLTDGYFQMMLHDWTITSDEQQTALLSLTQKLQAAQGSIRTYSGGLIPIGGDHLAPITPASRTILQQTLPHVLETTPDIYLNQLLAHTELSQALPIYEGELIENQGSFLLPGVYSSRMYLKQANRQAEHQLTHRLEPLLVMAQLLHTEPQRPLYPYHELEEAWKLLLLNHPHDSICGCSVDAVHRENETRFNEVFALVDALQHRAVRTLHTIAGPATICLLLNTSAVPYTGVVPVIEDVPTADAPSRLTQLAYQEEVLQDEYLADAARIPLSHLRKIRRHGWIFASQIPAFGYLSDTPLPGNELPPAVQATAQGHSLSNEFLSLTLEADGNLTILDKQNHTTHSGLLTFHAQPSQGDSYNHAPQPGQPSTQGTYLPQETTIVQSGPLVASLKTHYRLQSETPAILLDAWLIVTLTLQAHCPYLDISIEAHQPELGLNRLQVGFCTAAPIQTVVAETHLGKVTRTYDPTYREQDHMPAAKFQELKTNTGPIQRFISTQGQSWITQGLTEYEVFGNQLFITLVRPFQALSDDQTGVRGAQAGPPFPTPEGRCAHRDLNCRLAWLPTPPQIHMLHEAAGHFYGNIGGFLYASDATPSASTALHPQRGAHQTQAGLIHWDQPAIIAAACYWSPQAPGLVLRLINTSETTQHTTLNPQFAFTQLQEVNFLETPTQPPLDTLSLTLAAGEIKTLLFAV